MAGEKKSVSQVWGEKVRPDGGRGTAKRVEHRVRGAERELARTLEKEKTGGKLD